MNHLNRILILPLVFVAIPPAGSALGENSQIKIVEAVPEETPSVAVPETTPEWFTRLDNLTPGMTPAEVVEAIGRAPDSTSKSWNLTHEIVRYRYESVDSRDEDRMIYLIISFTDGKYESW